MLQPNYRVAIILDGEKPASAVVIADGAKGDKTLADNPTWVEVTGLDPMPGVDTGWTYVGGAWVPPVIPPPSHDEIESDRIVAYRRSADPLFFKYQRGEATEQEWLDAVQAVKDAHPYPDEV